MSKLKIPRGYTAIGSFTMLTSGAEPFYFVDGKLRTYESSVADFLDDQIKNDFIDFISPVSAEDLEVEMAAEQAQRDAEQAAYEASLLQAEEGAKPRRVPIARKPDETLISGIASTADLKVIKGN